MNANESSCELRGLIRKQMKVTSII